MKVTIITVCLNSKETIEDTIKSVLSQTYKNLEYIIVDGGSTDGTLDIVDRYKDQISKIIFEPDQGIYDAMNKGLRVMTGDVVAFLNSDDFYLDKNVISDVVGAFEAHDCQACYSDLKYVERLKTQKVVRLWKAGAYGIKKIYYGWIPPHPTFFAKSKLYKKYGLFNLDFKIASDYELMLRFILKGIEMFYLSKVTVGMREGGRSAQTFKTRIKGWKEIRMAWEVNGMRPPRLLILKRIMSKILQYKF